MYNFVLANVLTMFISLLQYWGILPHSSHCKNGTRQWLLLAKNVIVIMVVTVYGLSGIYFSALYIYPNFNSMYILVDISRSIGAILTVISFLPGHIFGKSKCILLLKTSIHMKNNYRKYRKLFTVLMLYIVIVHIFIIAMWTTTNTHFKLRNLDKQKENELIYIYIKYVIKFPLLAYYYENASVVLLIILLVKINENLLAMQKKFAKLQMFQFSSLTTLKNIKRLYLSAVELKVLINDYFGLNLLGIYANSAVRLLWFLVISIQMWNPDKFANALLLDWQHLAVSIGFGILGMVPACIMTMACSALSSKVEYHLEDCYRLQRQFPYESYEYRELLALTTYISANRLVFTAVDYFVIKPSVLLGIVGSSTTYFIAIIQFS